MAMQWPEDFNFDITRAINAPAVHDRDSSSDENYEAEKKEQVTTTVAVVEERNAVVDDDLDPVALNKAFRFAAWSSVVLVSLD